MWGSLLRFYVHEDHRHPGQRVWKWLLEQANRLGIRNGSAFKAMAGFGRHHLLHELLHAEQVRLFYAYTPVRFGLTHPESADATAAQAS